MKQFLEIPEHDKNIPITYYHQEGHILKPPHWHEAFEIFHVLEGVLTIGVEDKIIHIKKGETYIIDGGTTHYVLSSPGSVRIVFVIEFSIFNELKMTDAIMGDIRKTFEKIENHSKKWSIEAQVKTQEILPRLYDELKDKEPAYQYKVISYLYDIFVMLVRDVPEKEYISKKHLKFNNQDIIDNLTIIYEYIEANYQDDISLEKIASLVGYTPSYFARYFKKNTGKTFISFLNEYRLQKAKWLLSTSEKQSNEVALESGFQSRKTFHHVFKKEMGMSPLEYRKEFNHEL